MPRTNDVACDLRDWGGLTKTDSDAQWRWLSPDAHTPSVGESGHGGEAGRPDEERVKTPNGPGLLQKGSALIAKQVREGALVPPHISKRVPHEGLLGAWLEP